jgi:hypothetical protein
MSAAEQLVASVPPIEAIVRLAQKVPVFPCRRTAEEVTLHGRTRVLKPKSPLTSRGFLDATQDPDRIRTWWRRWPDALVGVPTGSITGLLVVDFDSHKADETARAWVTQHTDWLLQTRSHTTLNLGRHYLFRLPPGQHYGSGVNVQLGGQRRIGIDIRCEGGYIVWWPMHGGTSTGEIAPLPAGLIDERRIERKELPPLPARSPEKWAKDRQIVAAALAWVDPSSYDTWFRVGMAIHLATEGSEDGFHLWHAWSAGELTGEIPASYSGEADCRAHWASFSGDKPRGGLVTLGSVFATAKAAGWQYERKGPELPPLPDEPPPWLEDLDTSTDLSPESIAELEEQVDEKPERRPLKWSDLRDQQPPAREWAIPHWLGIGYVTLLAGPGGVGKSLLAQQLASSLATGDNFIEPLERARRVLMWAGEDDRDELWRRQAAIASYTGRELCDYGDLIIESYAGRDCTLATTVFGAITATKMLEELAEQVADYDADVVFLDNIARLFGGNENERHHVTLFVNLIAGACNRKKPTAVVLLGHPAKAEGSEWAGSTAWEAAVRSRWYFGRTLPDAQDGAEEADPDVRYLARRKSNYSGLDALQMRYDNVKHVIVPDAPKAAERGLRPSRAETLVLEALESFVKQGISTSDERRNPQFLPRVMVDRKLATRPMIPQLTDALYRLQKAGRITRQQVGVYANRSPRMGLGVA